jgi:hypothetical protein
MKCECDGTFESIRMYIFHTCQDDPRDKPKP